MNYGEILKKSYQVTIKNKILWLLGMLIASGTSCGNFNFGGYGDFGNFDNRINTKYGDLDFSAIWDYWYILVLIALLIIIFAVIATIISVIAKGGLIHGVNHAMQKKQVKFGESFKFGMTKFWRMLGIQLLLGLIVAGVVLILIIPGMLLLIIPIIGWVLGAILIIIGCLLAVLLAIIIALITNYIMFYAVLEDKKIMEAIKMGWSLFKKNIGDTVVMALILFGIGMGVALGLLIIIVAVLFLFGGIGFLGYLAIKWIGVIIIALIALIVLLIITLIAKGAINTFSFSCWLYTWRELVDKK